MTSKSNREHSSTGHDDWDFPPLYPPLPGELPDEFQDHPDSNEAFDDWVESTCGPTDDKQPVEQYDGTLGVTQSFVDNHESPVGNLHWNDNLDDRFDDPGNVGGVRWCSGTLVSEDLFLTAGHCFDQDAGGWDIPADDGATISPHEIATSMHVDFNYQVDPSGNLRMTESYQVEELVEYRVNGLDYAVVRLEGTPGSRWGTADLAANDAENGDMLCIIQHPGGSPKRIEAGEATHIHGSSGPDSEYFGYGDIDTLSGSSGSGMLRSPDGRIVGVHTNGGCTGRRSGHNHGVKIGEILDASSVLVGFPLPKNVRDNQKFAGDQKLKFVDDGGSVKFADDGGGTVKHIDDRKNAGLDKQPGDDVGGGKVPGADGGGGGTIKHVDDRKSAGLDKPPGGDVGGKRPGADGGSIGGSGGGGKQPGADGGLMGGGGGIGPGQTPNVGAGQKGTNDQKSKVLDEGKIKFTDDVDGTVKFVDDVKTAGLDKPPGTDGGGGKLPVLDGDKSKHLDDHKAVMIEKNPIVDTGGKPPAADGRFGGAGGGGGFGGLGPGQATNRPFVLRTPHHTMAWAQGGQGQGQHGDTLDRETLIAHYESLLGSIERLLRQSSTELPEVRQQYQRLIGEYRSLTGGSGEGQR
jgi:V8-like Glu-specific endopeptidase